MKFARITFTVAGVWGIFVILPLYFLYDFVGRQTPPPLTHPEFYFGFAGVALAWQVAFFMIASDPARYRIMMIPSIMEKLLYVLGNAALFYTGRITGLQGVAAIPDFVLTVFFIVAFVKTGGDS